MRNIDEHNITEAVIKRLGHGGDPRFNEIVSSLVRHLHDFVREVALLGAVWADPHIKAGVLAWLRLASVD